jgi:hypothetical protein
LENDEIGFTKRDPYLANKFESILAEFPKIRATTSLSSVAPALRTAEMKIFGAWNGHLSLLFVPNSQQEPWTVYLKNSRILKRIAVKVGAQFQNLQDSILLCAIELDKRTPAVEQQALSQVPFPDSGEDLLMDLVSALKL